MTTTTAPKETTIRIAIPSADGLLHGHFGGCREFTLVDADTQSLTVIGQQILPAPPHQPGAFPRWLREQGVRVVIAGGIGKRALDNFALHGIAVHAGEINARIEVLVAAYLAGQLTGSPVGCEHHGHEHGHHHHHEHDHDHEGCDHGVETAH
jgi:predicted Fe-Mo cluster-binding NifX family protein